MKAEFPWIYIENIAGFADQEVTIKGWLYNKRSSGSIHFLQIRDGTGVIQAVASKSDLDPETFELCANLTQESSITVQGKVRADKRAPSGYELILHKLQVHQLTQDYPITPKEHSVGFLLDKRHLWLRSSRQHAILRIRSEIIKAIRDFYDQRGFIMVDAPIFTPAACEGTSTLFSTEYFDTTAYLSQSGQLYMEAAALAHGKVYCFGPTFRAEKSKTRRHLTEFWMMEPEVAYAHLEDVMVLSEEMIFYIVERVLEKKANDLLTLERDISKLEAVKLPFPRISYSEAVKTLNRKGIKFEWGNDFGAPDETALSEDYDRPLIVHRFPAAIKAFYMEPDPEQADLALGMDMIASEGYGEIIGGGERASSLELLLKRIQEHKLPQEAFEWYLDLRRYGSVPHAGFGLGLERTVSWICGIEHLREAIPFPRMIYRISP